MTHTIRFQLNTTYDSPTLLLPPQKKVQTKKRPKLGKKFKCPFCANVEAVECKMDHKEKIGRLACRLCAASYQMPIHQLMEPIDVFSEWLDDCEAAARNQAAGGDAAAAAPEYNDEDDDDDDIPEPVDFGKKRAARENELSNKKQKTSKEPKQTFTDLGLDDSDSDSDEE